jgi:hypothetical protein
MGTEACRDRKRKRVKETEADRDRGLQIKSDREGERWTDKEKERGLERD